MGLRVGAIILVAALGACTNDPVERGITGALLGATAGVAGAAITENDYGTTALVGGLIGGAIGAVTSESDIDLGEPVYRRGY